MNLRKISQLSYIKLNFLTMAAGEIILLAL